MGESDPKQQALTNLTVAVDRFMDGWAESDQEVRHNLWVAMGQARSDAEQFVYPLGTEGKPYVANLRRGGWEPSRDR
jgi:hypothetical protein